jgi:hypothetical protein
MVFHERDDLHRKRGLERLDGHIRKSDGDADCGFTIHARHSDVYPDMPELRRSNGGWQCCFDSHVSGPHRSSRAGAIV